MSMFSENRVDFDASNVSLENSLFENSDITLLEAPLQLCENEMSMFNFMIECDFIEANNNTIMTEAEAEETNNENKKSKLKVIKDKVVNAITFVIEAIKKAVSKFIDKILELFKADSALLKKYAPRLTMDNLKNFPGVQEVESIEKLTKLKIKSEANMNLLNSNLPLLLSGISARDIEPFNAVKNRVEGVLDKLEKVGNKVEGKEEKIKTKEVWKVSDKGLSMLKNNFVSTSEFMKTKKNSQKMIAGLEKHRAKIDKEFPEDDRIGNAFYQLNNKYINAVTQAVNADLTATGKLYKAQRKILLTLIKYLNNGQKTETTTSEAASYEAIGVMSDLYVESVLCEY